MGGGPLAEDPLELAEAVGPMPVRATAAGSSRTVSPGRGGELLAVARMALRRPRSTGLGVEVGEDRHPSAAAGRGPDLEPDGGGVAGDAAVDRQVHREAGVILGRLGDVLRRVEAVNQTPSATSISSPMSSCCRGGSPRTSW